jgi:tape measure domain-containing protein
MDASALISGAKKSRAAVSELKVEADRTGSSLSTFGATAAGAFAGTALTAGLSALTSGLQSLAGAAVGAIGHGVKLAADYETASLSFEVMLGSADKATDLMKKLSDFGAATPFQLPELIDASKKLIAFGISTENLFPTLNNLGNVAAGLNIPFAELADVYGKIKVSGTVFNEDLNQLAGRGIPIQEMLAKQLGKTNAEIKKMSSDGKISFENIEKAFASLGGEGGKFAGLMDRQSKSLAGLWSTAQDTIDGALRNIATKLLTTFDAKESLTSMTTAIDVLANTALDSLGKAFTGAGVSGKDMGSVLIDVLDSVGGAIAWILDALDALNFGLVMVGKNVNPALAQVADALGMDGLAKQFDSDGKRAQADYDRYTSGGKSNVENLSSFFDQVRRNLAARQAGGDSTGGSSDFGGASFGGDFGGANATTEWPSILKGAIKQVEKWGLEVNELRNKLGEDARSIFEATRNPLEKYQEQVSKLDTLKANGLLDDDTFSRALAQAGEALLGALPQAQADQRVAAVERRSGFTYAGEGQSDDALATARKQLEEQKKGTVKLEDVARAIAKDRERVKVATLN